MNWRILIVVVALVSISCQSENGPTESEFVPLPAHMPPMPVPPDNPITKGKVVLGHRLFYEGRLSRNGQIPCASCHRPEASFSDASLQVSFGVHNEQGQRNAPTIINCGYRRILFWDARASSLEEQAMMAFTNPEEMNADTIAVAALMRSPEYRPLWLAAFRDTMVTMKRVMQAIATWERTLVAANSRFDRFVQGDTNALSDIERRGHRLFFGERAGCSRCHNGPDLTNDSLSNVGLFTHYFDRGRFEITRNRADEGRFKVPSLRNVALTPPYMNGGESDEGPLNTLEDVVRHYSSGVRSFINKDTRVTNLHLSADEQAELVAFLKTLTDSSVLHDPRFTAP